MTIRPALVEDAAHIAELLWATRQATMPYAPLTHTQGEVSCWIRDVLVPAGGASLQCDQGGRVLGFVATSQHKGVAWIDQLYVASNHLRRGVGTALLWHALAALPRPVHLYCFQANAGARAFYERHGFQAEAFSDGSTNEERCSDVRYVLT